METLTNTTTDTTTDTAGRQQYDHDAIKADLEASMSVREIADKHGCSPSLVQRIRRDEGADGERTPRNTQRAMQLKKVSERLSKDLTLLAKWKKNEAKVPGENDVPFSGVSELIGVLESAKLELETAAELYEALPAVVMTTKSAGAKAAFKNGMVVRAKAKFFSTYEALCSSPDNLIVRGLRDTHVCVEDTEGSRFFVASKDLEARPADA